MLPLIEVERQEQINKRDTTQGNNSRGTRTRITFCGACIVVQFRARLSEDSRLETRSVREQTLMNIQSDSFLRTVAVGVICMCPLMLVSCSPASSITATGTVALKEFKSGQMLSRNTTWLF